jgi:hypothetical protein
MKKLLVVFLCFFASNAFASSADSGKCPWKMPFTITISGTGETQGWGRTWIAQPGPYRDDDTSYLIPSSIESYQITIDTCQCNSIQYSLISDSLHFTREWGGIFPGMPEFQSVLIVFAPGKDSIISLSLFDDDSFGSNSQYSFRSYNFKISSLLFDDTSIFETDSSFMLHNASFTEETFDTMGVPDYGDDFQTTDFTASSITLSGIFRPTAFSNPPATVTEAPQPNNLAIYSSNGSIACSFDVADHARDLEILSPLGIREASFTIPAGQTQASLPHLPAGFYFVRLDGSMAKVYISD